MIVYVDLCVLSRLQEDMTRLWAGHSWILVHPFTLHTVHTKVECTYTFKIMFKKVVLDGYPTGFRKLRISVIWVNIIVCMILIDI